MNEWNTLNEKLESLILTENSLHISVKHLETCTISPPSSYNLQESKQQHDPDIVYNVKVVEN